LLHVAEHVDRLAFQSFEFCAHTFRSGGGQFYGPGSSTRSHLINQPVRNLFPVIVVGIVHRVLKLGFELIFESRNVARVRFPRLILTFTHDERSGDTYPVVGLAATYDVVVNFSGL